MQESSYELINEHQVVGPQVGESENVTTDKAWTQYRFTLKAGAGIPRDVYHEAMVVKVVSGSVAFRIGHEDVITLDPQGKPIVTLDWDDESETWKPTGELTCDVPCGLRSESPEESRVIRLDAGVTVYLPGSVTCFFCNTIRVPFKTG